MNSFNWVSLAMSEDSVRDYLNYVYSDGVNTVASDGHRLHVVYDHNLPAGFYDKSGKKVHEANHASFPQFERLTIKTDKLMVKNISFENWEVRQLDSDTSVYVINFDDFKININAEYLNHALAGLDNPCMYYSDDKNKPVLLETGKRAAIIMPIRINIK